MPPALYIAVAVVVLIIVCVIVFSVRRFIQNKYRNFAVQYSVCLKKLDEINRRYEFYPYVDLDQRYTYDNEKLYDTVSCKDYLIYRLRETEKQFTDQIAKTDANRRRYSQYRNEIGAVTDFGRFTSSVGKLNIKKLIKTERRMAERRVRNAPVTQFSVRVTLYCSTMGGRLYARKSERFSAEDIVALDRRLNDKSGSFYNDREIWDALCRVERGKVSNRLRFSIYERDGYRCCRCGVSDRHARLEIDHIVPIAKGGKSTYDNLQTLCRDCNVEKGDSLNRRF